MFTAKEAANNYISVGAGKTKLSVLRMLVLGFFAGAFIALAGVGATAAAVSISSASVAKLVGALIFPTGLAMVVICGAELFTGNNLIIMSVLSREASVGGMLKNWALVYIGNLVGSVIVAAAVVYGHTFSLFGGALAESAVSIAQSKAALGAGDAFIRGILCNVLVCIAVFMALCAKTVGGKIAGLYLPIMLFVLCGYEHSVANMYYLPAGLMAAAEYGIDVGALTLGGTVKNLVFVTLGNIVGGAGFVGCGFWLAWVKE